MIKNSIALILVFCLIFISACKKDKVKTNDCLPDTVAARQILNKRATVQKQPNGLYYLIEQGTIDTKLNPCNLPPDFQIDNLTVTITGEVKLTTQGGPGPCCTDDFVIFMISL